MAKSDSSKDKKKATKKAKLDPAFEARSGDGAFAAAEPEVHVYGKKHVCSTDSRGYATPKNKGPLELVLDASEGFIPLWTEGVTLRWRFNEPSMGYFQNPDQAKAGIRQLLGEALLAWGDAAPVQFTERNDAWDFEIVMRNADDCDASGCVLASAFFPDGGRHQLVLYPRMFTQSRKEQIDTFIHEIGHVFGLRHFFAQVSEGAWPSEIFGTHSQFSIMNYGHDSELTETDRSDLRALYQQVWSGALTQINGTEIVLVTPYHYLGELTHNSVAPPGSPKMAQSRHCCCCGRPR